MERIVFIVDEKSGGQRLDLALAGSEGQFSRRKAKWLITQGVVFIDGQCCRVCARMVNAGAEIRVTISEAVVAPPVEQVDIDVLYEDADALMVNKPSGMRTIPTPEAAEGSVREALQHRFGDLFLLNRLDIGTSGVVCLARTERFAKEAAEAFRNHAPVRKYIALVQGVVAFDSQTISLPIQKKAENRRFGIDETDGSPAETAVTTLLRASEHSLLLVAPQTEQPHQIRLHLAALGHPIVGDPLYGTRGPVFGLHALYLQIGTRRALAPLPPALVEAAENSGIPQRVLDVAVAHYGRRLDLSFIDTEHAA